MTDRQVEVVAGSHVVASVANTVIVVAHRDGSPLTAASPTAQAVGALVDIVRKATDEEPGKPGRLIAKLATKWIFTTSSSFEFGVLSPSGGNTAVFLHGNITAVLTDADGAVSEFLGSEAGFTTDRIVHSPTWSMALLVDNPDGSRPQLPAEPGFSSLAEGVQPGSAAVVWVGVGSTPPRSSSKREAVTPEPLPEDALATEAIQRPHPVPPPPAPPPLPDDFDLTPPLTSEPIDGATEEEEIRPPLPMPTPPDTSNERAPGGIDATELSLTTDVIVRGVLCANAHLNDPRVGFCTVCGLRMDQRTYVLVPGQRPPLGLLVLDDGVTYILDQDCVIGRDPENSDYARKGHLPIRLDDNSGAMSRVHAQIKLKDWDVFVIDLGSKNGTFVRKPGSHDWGQLPPNQPVVLDAGAEIRIGPRVVSFSSHHGRF